MLNLQAIVIDFNRTALKIVVHLVKDDDSHDLALDDNDSALVVDADSARMLQNVGAEFAHELTVLVVDLNLEIKKRKQNLLGNLNKIKKANKKAVC